MAIGIQNYPNVTPTSGDYPNGKSKDNSGLNDGTPINNKTLGDYQQTFALLLREVRTPANNLPDNDYTGFQYYEALVKLFRKYGEWFPFSANMVIPIANNDDILFNPLFIVPPGASSGLVFTLGLTLPRELSNFTIVNDSSNAITISSNTWALNNVVPTPTSTFSVAAGKSVEVTFMVISGQNNWIITKKP